MVETAVSERALADGFTDLKLHEIALDDIASCRRAVGSEVPISIDVNGNWSQEEAKANAGVLADGGYTWLEETIFPPEDFAALNALSSDDLPLAAGENWRTAQQFTAAADAGAVNILQPSVSKVGGVSEYRALGHQGAP